VEQCWFGRKNTQRTQVKGIANLQWAASVAEARGLIWLCAFGLAVLFGCTPLSWASPAHYPGNFHGCRFDQALSRCIRRFCSCIFTSNRKRTTHSFTMGVSFHSCRRWNDKYDFTLPGVFSLQKAQELCHGISHIFTNSLASLRDPWARTSKQCTSCGRISPFSMTEVNPSFK